MSPAGQINANTTIARSDSVIDAPMGDEVVMMSLSKSSYFGMDAIGAKIWERIKTPVPVRELCNELADVYDVERAQLEADVLKFLNELYDNDIICIVAPSAP